MTSERATHRQRDLRGLTLQRLKDHTELVALLEDVGEDASVIVPSFTRKQWHNPDVNTGGPPDAAISVMAVTSSSDRVNALEDVNMTVQVELEFRAKITPEIGVPVWADAVCDEISAVMTAQVPEWTAEGESGGTPEPQWDDSINRYRAVKRFDISRID